MFRHDLRLDTPSEDELDTNRIKTCVDFQTETDIDTSSCVCVSDIRFFGGLKRLISERGLAPSDVTVFYVCDLPVVHLREIERLHSLEGINWTVFCSKSNGFERSRFPSRVTVHSTDIGPSQMTAHAAQTNVGSTTVLVVRCNNVSNLSCVDHHLVLQINFLLMVNPFAFSVVFGLPRAIDLWKSDVRTFGGKLLFDCRPVRENSEIVTLEQLSPRWRENPFVVTVDASLFQRKMKFHNNVRQTFMSCQGQSFDSWLLKTTVSRHVGFAVTQPMELVRRMTGKSESASISRFGGVAPDCVSSLSRDTAFLHVDPGAKTTVKSSDGFSCQAKKRRRSEIISNVFFHLLFRTHFGRCEDAWRLDATLVSRSAKMAVEAFLANKRTCSELKRETERAVQFILSSLDFVGHRPIAVCHDVDFNALVKQFSGRRIVPKLSSDSENYVESLVCRQMKGDGNSLLVSQIIEVRKRAENDNPHRSGPMSKKARVK